MKTKEDIVPVSRLKSRTADLLAQVNKTHRPVVVTQNGVAARRNDELGPVVEMLLPWNAVAPGVPGDQTAE